MQNGIHFWSFFSATFGHLVPQKIHDRYGAIKNNSIWTPLKNKDQENYATEKDRENYARRTRNKVVSDPPRQTPKSSRPPHTKMTEVCKTNSLKLLLLVDYYY